MNSVTSYQLPVTGYQLMGERKKVWETKAAKSLSKVSFLKELARNPTQNFVHPQLMVTGHWSLLTVK